jgi:O-antigen polymerase
MDSTHKDNMVKISTSILVIYFVIILNVYYSNMGGSGLNLPQNIICWLVMLAICMLSCVFVVKNNSFITTSQCKILIAGCIVMTLPILWSSWCFLPDAIPRILGLWGGVAFFIALSQMQFSCNQKNILLISICIACIIQCTYVLMQLSFQSVNNWMEFAPGGRPYGTFQQVNVLASIIATGFCIGLRFFHLSRCIRIRCIWLLIIILFVFVLVLLQSRAGWLGAMIYFLFIFFQNIRDKVERKAIYFLVVVILFVLVVFLIIKVNSSNESILNTIGSIDKNGSNKQRWQILKVTLEMIMLHPFSGWGYGSFTYSFARVGYEHFGLFFERNVSHPHNEILFEWAEGGIIAVSGMLITLSPLLLSFRRRVQNNKYQFYLCGLMIPVIVHMMTEYPLYQSVPHWLVLILLFRLTLCNEDFRVVRISSRIPCGVAVMLCGAGMFLISGFYTQILLTRFERQGMRDFTEASTALNPWAQFSRYFYDENMARLMIFNEVHDPYLLRSYSKWALIYLHCHNDIHVYKNLISVNKILHVQAVDDFIKREGNLYYNGLDKK